MGEGRHDLFGEGAQAGDRGAGGGEQHILDTAGFEPLQLRDDFFGRAEQRRVVETNESSSSLIWA